MLTQYDLFFIIYISIRLLYLLCMSLPVTMTQFWNLNTPGRTHHLSRQRWDFSKKNIFSSSFVILVHALYFISHLLVFVM